nr:PHB depolymerase family esterase [Luteimonas aquatica]
MRTDRDQAAEGRFLVREVTVNGATRRYQVFVPSRRAGGAQPPVILFLHGSGERGDDGLRQTQSGLGPYVRAHADAFPAIVVFPQVPEDEEWYGGSAAVALAALDAASVEFGGDRDRTYLTGLSMGGYGTWELALRAPGRFAALVPICGGITRVHDARALFVTQVADDPDPFATVAGRLRQIPVWIFHGGADDVVPPEDDRKLIAAFRAARARDARHTELPGVGHNAWDPAYATPALWDWLFAQRR